MIINQKIKDLKKALESYNFRFSNYQDIPSFILNKIPELKDIKYKKNQIDLDSKRYVWIEKNIPKSINKACEIGSNLGYFAFSMANYHPFIVDAFEANKSYTHICNIFTKLVELEKKLKFYNESIDLKGISSLKNYDLIINLNVLHHAGVFFDQGSIYNKQDWINYSILYMKKLSEKSKFLIFQTGNMSNGKAIFSSNDTIKILKMIFDNSGWIVKKVGVINDLKNLDYQSYNIEEVNSIRLFKCRRDKEKNKVAYYSNQKLVSYMQTGLAQRPIWFCQKK